MHISISYFMVTLVNPPGSASASQRSAEGLGQADLGVSETFGGCPSSFAKLVYKIKRTMYDGTNIYIYIYNISVYIYRSNNKSMYMYVYIYKI